LAKNYKRRRRRMKTRFTALQIVSTIPLLWLAFLPFMSDQFVWQYTIDGTASRWGSKYELILYMLIPIVLGWGCYYWASNIKSSKDTMRPIKNARFVVTTAIIVLLALEALCVWLIIIGIRFDGAASNPAISKVLQVVFYFMGILLIIYGNQVPRASFNSDFGFKNSWSTNSEKAWLYTQRWTGVLCITCGVVMIVLNFVFSTFNVSIILLPVIMLVIGSYVISYISYQKTREQ